MASNVTISPGILTLLHHTGDTEGLGQGQGSVP